MTRMGSDKVFKFFVEVISGLLNELVETWEGVLLAEGFIMLHLIFIGEGGKGSRLSYWSGAKEWQVCIFMCQWWVLRERQKLVIIHWFKYSLWSQRLPAVSPSKTRRPARRTSSSITTTLTPPTSTIATAAKNTWSDWYSFCHLASHRRRINQHPRNRNGRPISLFPQGRRGPNGRGVQN